jgi:drug/metabolite transporter (DMT)-like permease
MLDPTTPTTNPRAYLALAGGVVCIGFAPIFIKLAGTTADVVGAYRLVIAAAVLAVPAALKWRRGEAWLPKKALGWALLAGVAFAGDIAVWGTAVLLTTASTATFLGNTAPVWVALGAWLLFGEDLRPIYWLGLAVALGGAALLVGLDGLTWQGASLGNVLALAGGGIYATYQLITNRTRALADNLSYTWTFTAVGGVLLVLTALSLGHPLTGLPTQSVLVLIVAAVFGHVGGWLLINYAFGELPAALVSVALLGQPVIATLVAAPVLGERPTVWHVVGGLVTLAGIFLVMQSRPRG